MRLRVGIVLALSALAGCAGPRLVEATKDGGVIAIPANSNAWPCYHRDKAEALIRQRCPNGYEIVREEEFVTGSVTRTNTQTNTQEAPQLVLAGANGKQSNGKGTADMFGGVAIPVGEGRQTTEQVTTANNVTEWRIRYRAK